MIRQVFDRAMPGSINLGLGEPDLPTPDTIRRAAVKAILEEQNGYTIHAGLLSLRELIAGDYMSSGITANDVIVTAGSQEALYLALLTIVDEGDEVLIPDPGFVAYPAITRMAGGTTTTYTLESSGGFSFDAETFRRSVTARTRVVVCISPSNPTGRVLSSADCKAIADALEGSGILVISDEIYRDLYFDEVRPASISDYYANTLVIGGLSKSTRKRAIECPDEYDRLASWLDLRCAGSHQSGIDSPWIRDDMRVDRFAKGGPGRVERRGRSGTRRTSKYFQRPTRFSDGSSEVPSGTEFRNA